jgi:hypothetical protein
MLLMLLNDLRFERVSAITRRFQLKLARRGFMVLLVVPFFRLGAFLGGKVLLKLGLHGRFSELLTATG